jgi:hypothetical protein
MFVDPYYRTSRDGIALAALLLDGMSSRADREIQRMAADASPTVRQLWQIGRTDPLLFRQKAAQFLRPVSQATSFIHSQKRDRLAHVRDILAKTYHDLIPGFGR